MSEYPRHESGHIVFLSSQSGAVIYANIEEIIKFSIYSNVGDASAWVHIERKLPNDIIAKDVILGDKYRILKAFSDAYEYKEKHEGTERPADNTKT